MCITEIKRIRSLCVLCATVVSLISVLRNAFAQDHETIEVGETVFQDMPYRDPTSVPNYRQELRKPIVEKEEYSPQELDSFVRYVGPRGTSSQSGKVGVVDSAAEYSYEIKAFGKIPVQFAVASRYVGIDNSTAVKLPAHLTSAGFGIETTLPFFSFDKTYFTIGLAPSFFSDNWDFRTQSFELMQRYFLIYQPNEKWVFVCGANYYPHFRPQVSPILGFIYKPNNRLTFSILPESPEISYLLNDKLTVFIQGDSTNNEYRVTKDNVKDVVLNYNETHLGAGLRYKWNKHVTGSLAVGGVLNRSIEYRQDSLGKVVIDDGFYTEFRLVMAM